MDDNQSKNIIPKKSDGRLSKASDLTKRGLHLAKNPTSVQHSGLSHFLDSVGGIPDNNLDVRFQEINKTLINYFSKMTVDEISRELEIEFKKRPNGRTLKLLGFSYFHGGNIDNAIRALTDCLKITSEDPVAIYELLGRCYVLKSDRENARRWFADSYRYDYEFFLEVFGWDFLYVTAVGRYRTRPLIFGEAADKFGKRALEIEIMADALSMCYGNKKGRKSLASAHVESVVSEMVSEYTKDSLKAIDDTKIIKDVVAQLLRELRTEETEPNLAKAYYDVGLTFLDQNLWEMAEDAFRNALVIDPSFAQAHYGLGILLANQQREKEAEEAYNNAIVANPNFSEAYYNLGVLLHDQNRLQEAENAWQKAITTDSKIVLAYYNLGLLFVSQNRFKEAEDVWIKAISVDPDFAQAHYSLGVLFTEQNRLEQAEDAYHLTIKANPNHADAYFNLGNLLINKKRLKESENAYRQATIFDPSNAKAHSNLGIVLQHQNRVSEAEIAFRNGIAADPSFTQSYFNLGALYYSQNRLQEAERSWRDAIRVDPNNAQALYNLGVLLVRQHRNLEANTLITKALQLDPSLKRFLK